MIITDSNIILLKLLYRKLKSYGGCASEEYHNAPGAANQKTFVITSVAGGSLACTFALGSFFVCFTKREKRPQKTDCASTTSMISATTSAPFFWSCRTILQFPLVKVHVIRKLYLV